MLHRWTTRGHERMSLPEHAIVRNISTDAWSMILRSAWLMAFLDGWLHRPPAGETQFCRITRGGVM
jgi:GMP synthase (glutamine-hydrolysing)